MRKIIYDDAYKYLIFQIRNFRKSLNLTQIELSRKLNKNDKYITKIELFDRRVDVLETLEICHILNINFVEMMRVFEQMVLNKEMYNIKEKSDTTNPP